MNDTDKQLLEVEELLKELGMVWIKLTVLLDTLKEGGNNNE